MKLKPSYSRAGREGSDLFDDLEALAKGGVQAFARDLDLDADFQACMASLSGLSSGAGERVGLPFQPVRILFEEASWVSRCEGPPSCCRERDFLIDNLLVRIHFIIEMI